MKKISKIQGIAIIIAVIVGIIAAVISNCNTPEARIAFTQPKPTKYAYETLKVYALGVAKGQYSDQNPQELTVDGPKVEGKFLRVNIETSKMYGIRAEFPISYEVVEDLKNGTIKSEGKILYDNATYTEYTKVESKFYYIILDLIGVLLFTIFVFAEVSEIERMFKIRTTDQ